MGWASSLSSSRYFDRLLIESPPTSCRWILGFALPNILDLVVQKPKNHRREVGEDKYTDRLEAYPTISLREDCSLSLSSSGLEWNTTMTPHFIEKAIT